MCFVVQPPIPLTKGHQVPGCYAVKVHGAQEEDSGAMEEDRYDNEDKDFIDEGDDGILEAKLDDNGGGL